MQRIEGVTPGFRKLATFGLLGLGLLTVGGAPAVSADRVKPETFDAQAMGTGTQMGQTFGVSVIVYEYSTPADKQILAQAFQQGQNKALVNALTKMKAVGHIAITGTLGFDLSFIRMIPTPTGRKIRFITNRPITFGEAWTDSQSSYFNLSAGELDLNTADKSKNTGTLYPAAQLVIDKQGQLQFELTQNAWNLIDVLDWQGTPGVN
jgi:hypothetical protein